MELEDAQQELSACILRLEGNTLPDNDLGLLIFSAEERVVTQSQVRIDLVWICGQNRLVLLNGFFVMISGMKMHVGDHGRRIILLQGFGDDFFIVDTSG